MQEQLREYASAVYRTCTPETQRRAMWSVFGSLLLFFYGTLFLGSVVLGASTTLTGESLQSVLTAINAARFELWMDMAQQDPLTRSVFGVMYPLVALAWTAGMVGVRLGYAVPELGYLIEGVNLLWPVVGIGFVVMQLLRFGQLSRE